jgi:hypothetical protein
MKSSMLTVGIVFALLFSIIVSTNLSVSIAANENHCFTCHTNPRKLIQITREIAKVNKGEPAKSSKTEGEG